MVLRKWKFSMMLGEEYSIIIFFPFPEWLDSYSGCPESVERLRASTWLRTWHIIFLVLTLKERKTLSKPIDSIDSSGWNWVKISMTRSRN